MAEIKNVTVIDHTSLTPQEILELYKQTGYHIFKPMNELTGDSDEYDFLAKAVEVSKDVEGMCIELGLRLGLGSKTIIDAVREFCPNKLVVSVDPFGNIPYTGREPDGETHYDYTDDMRNECMANMWAYIKENPVDYRFIQLSDYDFFEVYKGGIWRYGYNGGKGEYRYSMVHLDAQHTVKDVSRQIIWFNGWMNRGATLVIDDVTPDFLDFEPIEHLLKGLQWEELKRGGKKSLWRKL